MKINAVKFKEKASFEKNKSKPNVRAVYEPFQIVIFEDAAEVSVNSTKVKHVTQVDRAHDKTPSGLAICIATDIKIASEYLALRQVEIVEVFEATNTMFVEVPDFAMFDEFYLSMMSSKCFISVEPDYIQTFQSSAEMSIPAQWHLQNFKATETWSLLPADAYGEVAVLDIACETTHEDLQGQISDLSWNCVYDTADVNPISEYEKHGTCCSGLICAKTGNDIGVSSIGNNHLRVQFLHIGMNSSSAGSFFTSDTIVTRAVNKAIANPNCLAISMSWGGTNVYTMFANALTTAKNIGRGGKGICIFASSGNNYAASVTSNPAALPMVYAVGASAQNNTRAAFSNYGSKLFAAAPGTSVPTVDRTGASGYNATSNYTNFSGTSAACPVMAGCAAVVLLANPSLTEKQVTDIIASTAIKSGGYAYDSAGKSFELGYGVVDLYAAVVKAKSGGVELPPAPLMNLFGTISSPAQAIQGTVVPLSYTVQLDKAITTDITANVTIDFIRPDGAKGTFYTGNVTIAAGQVTATKTLTYTIPNNVTGVGQFTMYIDSTNTISESNESDNVAMTSIIIAQAPAPTLSLDVEAILTSYEWLDANRVRVYYRVTNKGATTVTSWSAKVGFEGRPSSIWNRNEVINVGRSVNAGTVWSTTQMNTLPSTFTLEVTKVNGVIDDNTSNNIATIVVSK